MHHPSAGFVGQLGGFPRLLMECNGQEAQKRVCKQIGGVAYLARFIVEQDLREGTLVEYALPKPFQLTIHLAQRRGRMLSLNARTFIERLKAFYEN
jgi:DNA-binding transcriptional LysR family regulator